MLDKALEALQTYDWGQDPKSISAIDEAIVASHGDAAKRKELEDTLSAQLKKDIPYDAKQSVCRWLMVIGTSASVPTLAELLTSKELSHMARYALTRNPAPEAAAALRDSLAKVSGPLKIGVISSLGDRGDADSVAALAGLLADGDPATARAAAKALGAIRSPEAAKAISSAKITDPSVQGASADASLACAEALLAAGKNGDALAIYKAFAGEGQPKHVSLAAKRGMLACAGKKE
jgi:HEAT repeat protein